MKALHRIRATSLSAALLGLGLLVFSGLGIACQSGAPQSASGSVATGIYRNLFAELGYPPEAIDAKIQRAFTQLFHGNAESESVYYPVGNNKQGPLAYILDIASHDVRSEGMSYGMMIAVQMDKKKEFDAIWNWAKTHMQISDPKHPAFGYFAWSVRTSGEPLDEMPAPDGEEYFVTALYFAAARWGDGEGIYDYSTEADRLLSHVLHRKAITGGTNNGTKTAISLFDRDRAMVRFTPDADNADRTDASYHLPAFYEVWSRVGPKADRAFWRRAAGVSRDYFLLSAHPETGLTPDYSTFDGSPWAASWRPESVDFRYDAWRSAMNWSMDWSWWQADPRQVELSNRLLKFFAAQGINTYVSLYTIAGEPLNKHRSTGLIAMNATAALAATTPEAEAFVRAFWVHKIPTGKYRYYDGMLYLMALLHVSGQYRVWLPTESPPAEN